MKQKTATLAALVRLWTFNISGTIAKKRREDLAVQAKKAEEDAKIKAAKKAAEDAGKIIIFV